MWWILIVFLQIESNSKLWYLDSLSCKVAPNKSLNFDQSKKFLVNLVYLFTLNLYLITTLGYGHSSVSNPLYTSGELKAIWAGLIHLSVTALLSVSLRQIIRIDWLELLTFLLLKFRCLDILAYRYGVTKLRSVSTLSLSYVLIDIALRLLI